MIGAVLAWLIIPSSVRPVLLNPWRIGAALAFVAGCIIALVVKTLTIPALVIITLPVITLVIVTLVIAALFILGAAVIVIARGALVLTTILARLALAGFGGFDQACLVIADHFDHIMDCDIGLIIAALITVV